MNFEYCCKNYKYVWLRCLYYNNVVLNVALYLYFLDLWYIYTIVIECELVLSYGDAK